MASHENHPASPAPSLEALSPAEKRALLAKLLAERWDRPLIRPLSRGQRRLWFFEQTEPGTSVFHLPFTLRLTGPLSASALESALTAVSARHETLRTAICVVDEQPVQIVTPTPMRPLVVRDLRDLAEAERRGEVERLTAEAADAPFDLAKAPLWRAEVLTLGDEEHLVLFTIHHLIADGWSIGVFLRDLVIAYEAGASGVAPGWQPLALQYGDVARLQQQPEYESRMSQQLEYWQEQFSGPLPVLQLPIDAPRPDVQTYRAARASATLAAPVVTAIKNTARRRDATLFMALLAALKVVLWRLSGETDIIVGAPVAGRARAEEEALIGLFINTIGLRAQLDPAMSFEELVDQVKRTAHAAYNHAEVPFDMVVQGLQLQRDQSRTPIFQVLFNLLGFRASSARLGSARMEVEWDLERSAKFDLTVYAREAGATVALELVYNADLFTAARMDQLAAQLAHVVEQVGARPEMTLADIDLAGAHSSGVLPDPRSTLPTSPTSDSVVTRLRRWSQAAPTATALVDARERWSYFELDERSSRLAHALREQGIGHGSIVAIYAHRSAGILAAWLAVWKAGAAFFVLDPAQPSLRLATCAEMVRPAAWIQMEAAGPLPEALEAVAATASCRLRMPASGGEVDARFSGVPGNTIDPAASDRAYVAFTSGSTGQPRAILGTHGPLSHFLEWYERAFALTSSDRISVLSGLAHDPLFRDLLAPIWAGGTAVMPESERILEPRWLSRWMAAEGVTVTHVTPPMAELLLHGASPDLLGGLRAVFFGGDRLRPELVRRFRTSAPHAAFVNFYGATETPQAMGFHVVDPDSTRPSVPAGVGIDGVQLLVLSDAGRLAGVGELGEIFVRTPYLAERYLGDAEATSQRFLSNPFTGSAGDRVYRTGDWGRYLPDGAVEFVGRRDFQVKVRGYRIELSEIDQAICRHPDVANAVTVALETGSGDPQIVSYVVPRGNGIADSRLRAHIRAHLPDYMQPEVLQSIAVLPLTANGKIDRRALPVPGRQASESETKVATGSVEAAIAAHPAVDRVAAMMEQDQSGESRLVVYVTYRAGEDATASELRRHLRGAMPDQQVPALFVPLERIPLDAGGAVDRIALPSPFGVRHSDRVRPRTPSEHVIAAIWGELLRVEELSVRDNFFDVGGHSLLSVQAAVRIEKRTGVRINPRLLAVETLEQLAARCDREAGASGGNDSSEAVAGS